MRQPTCGNCTDPHPMHAHTSGTSRCVLCGCTKFIPATAKDADTVDQLRLAYSGQTGKLIERELALIA